MAAAAAAAAVAVVAADDGGVAAEAMAASEMATSRGVTKATVLAMLCGDKLLLRMGTLMTRG